MKRLLCMAALAALISTPVSAQNANHSLRARDLMATARHHESVFSVPRDGSHSLTDYQEERMSYYGIACTRAAWRVAERSLTITPHSLAVGEQNCMQYWSNRERLGVDVMLYTHGVRQPLTPGVGPAQAAGFEFTAHCAVSAAQQKLTCVLRP